MTRIKYSFVSNFYFDQDVRFTFWIGKAQFFIYLNENGHLMISFLIEARPLFLQYTESWKSWFFRFGEIGFFSSSDRNKWTAKLPLLFCRLLCYKFIIFWSLFCIIQPSHSLSLEHCASVRKLILEKATDGLFSFEKLQNSAIFYFAPWWNALFLCFS